MDGFFFSENTHTDPDGTRWGFYRFNHKEQAALTDIDFSFSKKGPGYSHIHGDDYRFEFSKGNVIESITENKVAFVKPESTDWED